MLWENLREEEFEGAIERSGGLCVIPMGCLEKHGQHLPVGTDSLEGESIVLGAAEAEDVMIFRPGMWFGEVSCFHAFDRPEEMKLRGCIGIKQETLLREREDVVIFPTGFWLGDVGGSVNYKSPIEQHKAGYICLSPELRMQLLAELCDEIARNGFRKILIVNAHGGNGALLKHFLRCQTYSGKKYATLVTSAFAFGDIAPKKLYNTVLRRKGDFSYLTEDDIETLKRFAATGTGGGHADIRETCLVMEYDESLVAPDRYEAERGESNHRTDYLSSPGIESANAWLANFPSSYEALPPHGASATIGRAMKSICAWRLAKIFKLLKEDEDCVKSAQMLPKCK